MRTIMQNTQEKPTNCACALTENIFKIYRLPLIYLLMKIQFK
jgi:hypothetical protein